MAGGGDVVFFGLSVSSWTGRNEVLSSITDFLHGGLVMNFLLALIAGHVLAALWQIYRFHPTPRLFVELQAFH
jgi:cytochrome b561